MKKSNNPAYQICEKHVRLMYVCDRNSYEACEITRSAIIANRLLNMRNRSIAGDRYFTQFGKEISV